MQHFNWERLRRAELDMERVKQWMRADDLVEQERQLRSSLQARAGVLGLMLHSTFNHDLVAAQAAAQKRKIMQMQQLKMQQQLKYSQKPMK